MDVKITINISTRAFGPCNGVAMKWLMGLDEGDCGCDEDRGNEYMQYT